MDPEFMTAASALAITQADIARDTKNPVTRLAHAREAKRWAEVAARLAPGGAGDVALAFCYAAIEADGQKALPLAESAVRALPNDALSHNTHGIALRALGREADALLALRQARDLDPFFSIIWSNELRVTSYLRRPTEFDATVAKFREAVPERSAPRNFERWGYILTGKVSATLENLTAAEQRFWLWQSRRFSEAEGLIARELASPTVEEFEHFELLCEHADVLARLGRADAAQSAARAALAIAEKLQTIPEVGLSEKPGWLARALVRVGRGDEAIASSMSRPSRIR